jgi:hypothetical protein
MFAQYSGGAMMYLLSPADSTGEKMRKLTQAIVSFAEDSPTFVDGDGVAREIEMCHTKYAGHA